MRRPGDRPMPRRRIAPHSEKGAATAVALLTVAARWRRYGVGAPAGGVPGTLSVFPAK